MSDGYDRHRRGRSMSRASFDSFSDARSSSRRWAGRRDSRDGRRIAESRRPRFNDRYRRGRSMSRASRDSFFPGSRSRSRRWARGRDSRDGRRIAESRRRPRLSEDSRSHATSRSRHRYADSPDNYRHHHGESRPRKKRRGSDFNSGGSRLRRCPDECRRCRGRKISRHSLSEDRLSTDRFSEDYYGEDEGGMPRDETWKEMYTHGHDMMANAAKLKTCSERYEEMKEKHRALQRDNATLRNCVGVACHDMPHISPLEDSPLLLLNAVHTVCWKERRREKELEDNLEEAVDTLGFVQQDAARNLEAERSKSKKETEEREKAEDQLLCVICMERPRKKLLLPCAHFVLCDHENCYPVSACPICLKDVRSNQDVFFS
ncbi:unnamed protein product [Ectocarpus fasciculatus]